MKQIDELFENPVMVEANPVVFVRVNNEFADLEFLFRINGKMCRMREVVLSRSEKFKNLEECYQGFDLVFDGKYDYKNERWKR